MDKDKKKLIAGGVCLAGAAGLTIYMLRRGYTPPPPPPPGEDVGMLQGHILDSSTSERLSRASVTIIIDNDQSYINDIDTSGTYRTPYLPFGTHHFTVQANNYETGEFDLEISETFAEWDFVLNPLPEAPTDWTEGVEVREIHVTSPVYVGETQQIGVAITYPDPLPLPADIYGSILIDSLELTGQWTIDIRNPRVYFEFTPTVPGTYLVRAQDKSAIIEVLEKVISTYYNPFGGVRIPVCTRIVIPVDGDIEMGGEGIIPIWPNTPLTRANAHLAYPIAWNPAEAEVTAWDIRATSIDVYVTPINYTCPEYWSSKAELAKVIADCSKRASSSSGICIVGGWRDWIKFPNYWNRCGGGYCSDYLDCPYCGESLFGGRRIQGSARDRVKEARNLLEHIEQSHRDHPLTEPAWF